MGPHARQPVMLVTGAAAGIGRGITDRLVANGALMIAGDIDDGALDAWQEIIDLCLAGVFLTIKHAGRMMRDGGSIVNIASLNAIQPAEGMSAYCTAKAG